MLRKTSLMLLGAAAGVSATLLVSDPHHLWDSARAQAAVRDTYSQLMLFGDVFERVRDDFVEKPDDRMLIESAISGMLAGLDPHSSYMDPQSYRDMQIDTSGEFGGLGLEVIMENGLVKVIAPIDDTPAAKAGVMANDVITHIDGEAVQGLSLSQAVDKMRGPLHTKVKLSIMRRGQDNSVEVSVEREIIHMLSVNSHLEGEDVGLVRITQFTEHTGDGLSKALAELSMQSGEKLKGFIVDLRNNPGGLLDQAVAVCDAFLERGEIVSTRGREPEDIQRYSAHPGDLTRGKPIIVLINGGSASASEIVAGALQDHRRATIIGTRSFGKGSVQTIIPLGSNNGALRLTTGRYFTPSGRSIQAKGISPDIEVLQDVPEDLETSLADRHSEAALRGHLKAAGDEQTGSQSYIPPDPKNDKALHTALDLIRGVRQDPAYPPNPKAMVPN
jgi:carboxyl-terminal processing protease